MFSKLSYSEIGQLLKTLHDLKRNAPFYIKSVLEGSTDLEEYLL